MAEKSKRVGRPPAGDVAAGEPVKIRDYPKLNVTIRPVTKATLKAVSMIEGRADRFIIEDAITQYVGRMPAADRQAIENLAKRTIESTSAAARIQPATPRVPSSRSGR